MKTKQNQTKRLKRTEGSLFTKRSGGEKVVFTVAFIFLLVYSISLVIPTLWMLMNSFKDGTEYALDIVGATTQRLPEKWLISNYLDVYQNIKIDNVSFLEMLANSAYFIIIGALGLYWQAAVAYVLSKYEFKANKYIYATAIFCMTLPIMGNTAASLKLNASLGIYDNLLAPIVTSAAGAFGFNFLLLYGFFKNVSSEYMEAASIDGASHFAIFWHVMFPQAMPMLSTFFILHAISAWADYATPMLYFPSHPNVAYGLYLVSNELTRGDMPSYFAALVLSALPVLILFAVCSDKIMKNYSIGGLKG